MNRNISVVIATMGRPQTLRRTLEKMLQSTVLPKQMVIVDQSSDENQRTEIQNYRDLVEPQGIEYVYYFQEEPSLTKARNKGVELSSEETLVFSDDDVDVKEDTFQCVCTLMQDKNLAMIAGLDSRTDLKQRNASGYLWGRKSFKKRKMGHVTKSMYGVMPLDFEKQTKTEWAMGFFFVVRKSLLLKWNIRWDEKLISYAYAEDLDFSYSYAKKAAKEELYCIFDKSVQVEHLQSQEYRIPTKKFTNMYILHREYLSYKHFKCATSRFLTRWSNIGMFFWRLLKRQKPFDLVKAQVICDRNRRRLKKGEIPVEVLN